MTQINNDLVTEVISISPIQDKVAAEIMVTDFSSPIAVRIENIAGIRRFPLVGETIQLTTYQDPKTGEYHFPGGWRPTLR